MFLLSDGLLTWMCMASFFVPGDPLHMLVNYCERLCTCWVTCRIAMMGGGALRCSFSLSLNVLSNSPIYSSGQLMCGHLNLYMTPLFWRLLYLSLGAIRKVLMVLLPLKCTWIPKLLHILLNISPSLNVWYHYGGIFAVWSIVVCIVGLVVSSCLSIVDVVFMVKFVI